MPPEIADFSGPDVARLAFDGVRVAHCRLPAWELDAYSSLSEPASVALSFTAQRGTVLTPHGRYQDQAITAGSVGLAGPQPAAWVSVNTASELIEISADATLRREVAEDAGVPLAADLDDRFDTGADPVAWGVSARLRAAARGGRPLAPLEGETLARRLYARVFTTAYGGRLRTSGGLDERRLRRVVEAMAEACFTSTTLAQLADAAALSPFHFVRSFKRATGLAPHQYLTAMRMQAVADRLRSGETLNAALARVGYASPGQGRAAFRRWLGR